MKRLSVITITDIGAGTVCVNGGPLPTITSS